MAKRGKQKQKQKGKPAAGTPASPAAEAAAPAVAAETDAAAPEQAQEQEQAQAQDRQEPGADGDAGAEAPAVDADAPRADAEQHAFGAEDVAAADEAETVAESGPDAADTPAAAPAPQPRRRRPARPRDRRSPFVVLADYEQRSLAHIPGLPEQLDAPGLWRGVAYRIGARRLASGFDEVLEILPMPTVTHVPGSMPWMLGVANIRGTLLPVVDLKQFLEGERTVLQEKQRVLVVHQPGGDIAVTIDELYGQRSFNDSQGVDATAIADGRYVYFVDRAYRFDGHDWGVFSLDRLARTPEFRQAAA